MKIRFYPWIMLNIWPMTCLLNKQKYSRGTVVRKNKDKIEVVTCVILGDKDENFP